MDPVFFFSWRRLTTGVSGTPPGVQGLGTRGTPPGVQGLGSRYPWCDGRTRQLLSWRAVRTFLHVPTDSLCVCSTRQPCPALQPPPATRVTTTHNEEGGMMCCIITRRGVRVNNIIMVGRETAGQEVLLACAGRVL